MIAFVLSGGGSLGAIQAGMLEALLERDQAGLRDLGRAASLIDQARTQTRLFLAGQPCDTCTHEGSRRGINAPVEEVVRPRCDLSIA